MEGKIIKKNQQIVEVYGYKAFEKVLTGKNNFVYEVGKTYHNGNSCFMKSGFHMCLRLEDTLRYFLEYSDVEFCFVRGFGKIQLYDDDYHGYYDLFSCSSIEIIKKISRKEILETYYKMRSNKYINDRYARFVWRFSLTEEERQKYDFDKKKVKFIY